MILHSWCYHHPETLHGQSRASLCSPSQWMCQGSLWPKFTIHSHQGTGLMLSSLLVDWMFNEWVPVYSKWCIFVREWSEFIPPLWSLSSCPRYFTTCLCIVMEVTCDLWLVLESYVSAELSLMGQLPGNFLDIPRGLKWIPIVSYFKINKAVLMKQWQNNFSSFCETLAELLNTRWNINRG